MAYEEKKKLTPGMTDKDGPWEETSAEVMAGRTPEQQINARLASNPKPYFEPGELSALWKKEKRGK
jgi:hypothetical protein